MNQLMICTLLIFLSSLNGSLTCRFHEQNFPDVEKILVQTFKRKLLKELGFSSVPNVSKIKAPKVPSFYKRLIEVENSKPIQTSELDEDDFHAKTNQLFLFPEQVVSITSGTERNLIFKSNPRHQTLEVVSAFLWILIVDAPNSDGNQDLRKGELQLYKSYLASGKSEKEHFHSEHLKAAGWYKVEVSRTVKEWFSEQPKLDLSLDVAAVKGTRSLEIGGVRGDDQPLQPFLEINTKEKRGINRSKRRVVSDDCQPGAPPSTCCLQELTIDFEKLKWDFIIAPRILNFGVCRGDCSLNVKRNVDFFSNQLRAAPFLGKLNPQKQKKISCCVPKTTNDITLLMFDDNGDVRFLTLPDTKALSCHCIV